MPDSVESRLGRLEQGFAKLGQHVDDLSVDVRAMAPLIVQMAESQWTLRQVQAQLDGMEKMLEATAKKMAEAEVESMKAKEEERKQLAKERKSDRNWLITTVLGSSMFIIAAIERFAG